MFFNATHQIPKMLAIGRTNDSDKTTLIESCDVQYGCVHKCRFTYFVFSTFTHKSRLGTVTVKGKENFERIGKKEFRVETQRKPMETPKRSEREFNASASTHSIVVVSSPPSLSFLSRNSQSSSLSGASRCVTTRSGAAPPAGIMRQGYCIAS